MTQRERVLKKAHSYDGVCQADFLLPNVCDEGPPITRVAARLFELESEGYCFDRIGWRDKCKVFRLTGVDSETRGTAGAVGDGATVSSKAPCDREQAATVAASSLAVSTDRLFALPADPHYRDAA